MTKGKIPTKQVLAILKGTPITNLEMGNWGSHSLRTCVPNPVGYFTCQKYGNHRASCKAKPKCGVCQEVSGSGDRRSF